jgi:hypothetical protein
LLATTLEIVVTKRILTAAAAASLIAGSAGAQRTANTSQQRSVLLYRDSVSFLVDLPTDWVVNSVESGPMAIFYRASESWATGSAVMYANTLTIGEPGTARLAAKIRDEERQWSERAGDASITTLPAIRTTSGSVAEVRKFVSPSLPAHEAVAYLANGVSVVTLVLSAKSDTAFAGAYPAFARLVRSYAPAPRVRTDSARTRVALPDSGLAYSRDSSLVAFVRRIPRQLVPTALDSMEKTELWVAHRDGTSARQVVAGKSAADPRYALAGLSDPAFSPNGREIYFLSVAWVTSGAVHVVNLSTGQEKFVAPGNSLEVIATGEYAGCLLVGQHRYWLAGGSYDWLWLLTPEGKEVGPVVDDSDESARRLREWRLLSLKPDPGSGARSAQPGAACRTPAQRHLARGNFGIHPR